ncbi:NtaA/DmoA family FMN-dependent monooxygenase [Gordonia sp. ABSL11-1]|nr:NtaA/DmoA family FMN-dependent monooxygenase [Gordonia sp. ABSL11-1]MDL9948140.1 NtaA/DmoA family FMN-dependent monooxygenase [Gordonia sp. ABSL11-1]
MINAFLSGAASHLSPGQWRNPEDRGNTGFVDLAYWSDLARTVENAKFDAIFFADSLGVPDSVGGTPDYALRHASQTPNIDPLPVVAALIGQTSRLGFGLTASTTYERPFSLARRFTALDHLSGGRIGWNIVTSILDSAAKNFGLDKQIPHDERYDRGQDFLDATYKLWEGSWEDGALVRDVDSEMFVDPSKVHRINHEGKYFHVAGPLSSPPSDQRTPVLFQAGASPRGVRFAAENAEVVFTNGDTDGRVRTLVANTRAHAASAGRDPGSLKFVMPLAVITGSTDAEAREKYQYVRNYASETTAVAMLSGWTGHDWTHHDLDAPIVEVATDAQRSILPGLAGAHGEPPKTLREAARNIALGGRRGLVVGGPASTARELVGIANRTGVDGFNLFHITSPGTYKDFADHVIPVLQEQGHVWPDYPSGTLRERLMGTGSSRIAPDHRARRLAQSVVTSR